MTQKTIRILLELLVLIAIALLLWDAPITPRHTTAAVLVAVYAIGSIIQDFFQLRKNKALAKTEVSKPS